MAISKIKGTYTLDVDTVRAIEALARRWATSKSEVLRRAVQAAAVSEPIRPDLAALDKLQRRLTLTDAAAAQWAAGVREGRRSR